MLGELWLRLRFGRSATGDTDHEERCDERTSVVNRHGGKLTGAYVRRAEFVEARRTLVVRLSSRQFGAWLASHRSSVLMPKLFRAVIWVLVAVAAAGALAHVALTRGETVNAAWLLTAAVCSYAVAYRFY